MVNRRVVLGAMSSAPAAILLPRIVSAAKGGDGHVRAVLEEYVAKKKIPGAVAVVGDRDGPRFVSSGRIAFGEEAAACGPDSLWRIYSMTKLVTGAAAMLLLEEGKLALDTPVGEIFPTFHSSQVLVDPAKPDTRNAKSAVTVRHLMTHTSGLVGSMVSEPPLGALYLDRKLNVVRVSIEMEKTAQHQSSLMAFAAAAGTVPLVFDPGTRWSYSLSSDVLGAVVEKISGMPFERFLQTRLFDPLGMTDTSFMVGTDKLSRFATNYQASPDGLRPVDAPPRSIFAQAPPFPYPSSGLVSSARNFASFAAMLLGEGSSGGVRILSAPTARLMMSNLLPDGVRTTFGQGWGAGGAVLMAASPKPTPLGMTAGTYGWQGAAGTVCWVDRATGIYAILMAQYMPTEAYGLHADFAAAAFADRAV